MRSISPHRWIPRICASLLATAACDEPSTAQPAPGEPEYERDLALDIELVSEPGGQSHEVGTNAAMPFPTSSASCNVCHTGTFGVRLPA